MKTSGNNRLSNLSVICLVASSIMLAISIFVPMWRIDLNAPQYPEGLCLLIYPDKLGGNVDIINGLNHYIGMKTLHTEDFVEFRVLSYIIGAYALATLLTAIMRRRRLLNILFAAFVLFGVVAMVDFYKWEYDYGHNLDPNAAIIVPGMAYQPPLIGFKQLLNFGAYSVPSWGGWLFVGSGVLMLLSIVVEYRRSKKVKAGRVATAMAACVMLTASSCARPGPEPVRLNKDNCSDCGMTISDGRFAVELITQKGRIYKFDDLSCYFNYKKANDVEGGDVYVSDFTAPGNFLKAQDAAFITGEKLGSPMGGNIAAFATDAAAKEHAGKLEANVTAWNSLGK